MQKKSIQLLLILLGLNFVSAQNSKIKIIGKIVESKDNLPIGYATISVLDNSTKKPLTKVW